MIQKILRYILSSWVIIKLHTKFQLDRTFPWCIFLVRVLVLVVVLVLVPVLVLDLVVIVLVLVDVVDVVVVVVC